MTASSHVPVVAAVRSDELPWRFSDDDGFRRGHVVESPQPRTSPVDETRMRKTIEEFAIAPTPLVNCGRGHKTTSRVRLAVGNGESFGETSQGRRHLEQWERMMMRGIFLIVTITLAAACNNRSDVECELSSNCDLSGGGMCLTAPTGNMWCAYPDPECPGGYRYSDSDVGDGLSGDCVATSGIDGGVDGPTSIDAPPDGPLVIPGSWSKQIPGAGFESVDGIAVASDGSVFITGSFDGALDLGGGPMTATGTYDVFVAKFTSAGGHVWSTHFGGSSSSGGTKLKVLTNGDLALGGSYRGTLVLGTTTLTSSGDQDVYVARLSSTGTAQWAVTGGAPGFDELMDLAVDASDNIAACGGFNGTGTFFGTGITGSYDSWLVRLTGAGTPSWTKAMTAGGIDDNCGVAMTSNGDVVHVGSYNGTVNTGGTTFTSTSNTLDIFVGRYLATTGAHVWSASLGGAGNDEALDVEAAGTSIIVAGRFGVSVSFGGVSLTSAGGDDAFVAKFDDTTGAHQFSTRMGGTSGDVGQHLSIRPDGQVSLTGTFAGTANFGGTSVTSNGDIDPFLVDLDGLTGVISSVKSAGGPSRDEAHDVVSTSDSLVFAGSFTGSIVVLGTTYTTMGSNLDGYLARYKR